jgi:exopolysaccharide biosynthesis polyprenyl glycosylphosphotransferase
VIRISPVERCLLVGDPSAGIALRRQFALSASLNAEVVGVVPAPTSRNGRQSDGLPHELGETIVSHEVERVILAPRSGDADELLYTIRELKQTGVKVSVLPEISRMAGPSVELDFLHGITLLGMRQFEFTRSSRAVKRSFDLVGSALILLLVLPLLAIIALAVKVDSRGPVLFRQARIGREGKRFGMLKFRSMVDEADHRKEEYVHMNEGADGLFKISDDPRVTRIGRWLRRWQLDELPQLLNVLRGEMSLVGPRPLIPEEDGQIEGWYRRRLDVPPGMTGHWQVLGSSSAIPLDEMVKLDYLYVATWSLWGDIRLLLRTVPFMIGHGGV